MQFYLSLSFIKTLSFLLQLYNKEERKVSKSNCELLDLIANCNILDLNFRYEVYNINC